MNLYEVFEAQMAEIKRDLMIIAGSIVAFLGIIAWLLIR